MAHSKKQRAHNALKSGMIEDERILATLKAVAKGKKPKEWAPGTDQALLDASRDLATQRVIRAEYRRTHPPEEQAEN